MDSGLPTTKEVPKTYGRRTDQVVQPPIGPRLQRAWAAWKIRTSSIRWDLHQLVHQPARNIPEHPETLYETKRLREAVLDTLSNSRERIEPNSGSVSPGSNPGPAAPHKPPFAGLSLFARFI